MTSLTSLVLWLWVPAVLWVFRRTPAPLAVLIGLIGGWLVLPTARYPDAVAGDAFPYWIMPACLPSVWTTRARMTALGCLLGVALFDRRQLRSLRFLRADLAMLGWCLCPFASAVANRLPLAEALANAAYQSLCWGAPYLLGRLYFAGPDGMVLLARGVVGGGLATGLIGLLEFGAGPWVYRTLYGFHPFQEQGAERYAGYRPLVFFEDGNQLGMWQATAALVAVWLWRSGQLDRLGQIPGPFVVAALVGVALLSQSVGAILLLILALVTLETVRRLDRVWPLAAALVVVLGLVGIRAVNLVDARALAQRTSLGRSLIEMSVRLDRKSFGWRLRQEEKHAHTALQRPWLGWGRWDWWSRGPGRPWGLFSLVLGMYGLVGLSLLLGCFVTPLIRFLTLGPPHLWTAAPWAAATSMAAALAINGLDAILNGAFLLPLLLAAGGLVGIAAPDAPVASSRDRSGNVRYRVR